MVVLALRQFASLNALVVSLLFAFPALEALTLRRELTLSSRYPFVVLVLAYACAGVVITKLERTRWRFTGLVAVASFGALVLTSFVARAVLDTSWDGITYHQPAIYELHDGWNPFTRSLRLELSVNNLWINEYPKAAWYASSVLLGVFGDVDAAKLSFVLGVTVFASALRVLATYEARIWWRGFVAAALLVLNPVVIVQLWQFYVDGVLYLVLMLAVLSAVAYARERRVLDLVSMIAMLVFVANVKFTGIVYAVAILGWLLADQLLSQRRAALAPMLIACGAFLALVAVLGADPYVTHVLAGQHPFHPIFGPEAIDIVTPHVPPELLDRNWSQQLLRANASFLREKLDWLGVAHELALLGTGAIGELEVSPRLDGFGRYFWLIYSLAHVAGVYAIARRRSLRLGIAVGCFTVLSVLNPVAWWARYVPQLWAAPIIVGTIATNSWRARDTWPLVAASFYLAAVSAQLWLGQSWERQVVLHREVHRDRDALLAKVAGASEVRVGVLKFAAHYYWLKEQGVPVVRVPDGQSTCPEPFETLTMTVCVDRD